MDLTSLYSDFVMDGREVLFHSTPGGVSSFHDNEGHDRPGAVDGSCAGTEGRSGAA